MRAEQSCSDHTNEDWIFREISDRELNPSNVRVGSELRLRLLWDADALSSASGQSLRSDCARAPPPHSKMLQPSSKKNVRHLCPNVSTAHFRIEEALCLFGGRQIDKWPVERLAIEQCCRSLRVRDQPRQRWAAVTESRWRRPWTPPRP
jgi:hypothetical protein